ncbi:MAG TPA: hypothetical protein VMX79_06130 [bacterium]|nr:hypothetical protein [bacterium]
MGKEYVKLITVGAALAVAANVAYGEVGSVISSFRVNVYYPPEMTTGVYRDAAYVYIVTYDYGENFYLIRYTPDGTKAGTIGLGYLPFGPALLPYGADHSVSGAGYVSFSFDDGYLLTYSTSTGSLVESIQREPYFDQYAFIPGGRSIYVGLGSVVYRMTRAWSVVNSFPFQGFLGAATEDFNGGHGQYIITERYGTTAYVYAGTGSLVSTFSTIHSGKDTVCGPGYPASYGTTYWRFINTASDYGWCYQIDLGGATAVAPASLGKVKALFR